MVKLLLMISAVFIVSNCASSKPEPNPTKLDPENAALAENTASPEKEESGEEELICTKERVTGTRLITKTCLTKAQRDQARENSRSYIDRLKRSPEQINSEPSG